MISLTFKSVILIIVALANVLSLNVAEISWLHGTNGAGFLTVISKLNYQLAPYGSMRTQGIVPMGGERFSNQGCRYGCGVSWKSISASPLVNYEFDPLAYTEMTQSTGSKVPSFKGDPSIQNVNEFGDYVVGEKQLGRDPFRDLAFDNPIAKKMAAGQLEPNDMSEFRMLQGMATALKKMRDGEYSSNIMDKEYQKFKNLLSSVEPAYTQYFEDRFQNTIESDEDFDYELRKLNRLILNVKSGKSPNLQSVNSDKLIQLFLGLRNSEKLFEITEHLFEAMKYAKVNNNQEQIRLVSGLFDHVIACSQKASDKMAGFIEKVNKEVTEPPKFVLTAEEQSFLQRETKFPLILASTHPIPKDEQKPVYYMEKELKLGDDIDVMMTDKQHIEYLKQWVKESGKTIQVMDIETFEIKRALEILKLAQVPESRQYFQNNMGSSIRSLLQKYDSKIKWDSDKLQDKAYVQSLVDFFKSKLQDESQFSSLTLKGRQTLKHNDNSDSE